MRKALAALFAAVAGLPTAADIVLRTPIDCALGRDCFIQQYVDHDRGTKSQDYLCAGRANNGHTGTDFRIATMRDIGRQVNVVAAAPGVVRSKRDGMADRLFERSQSSSIRGKECGNGVVIDHADGWSTQYCHLKRGSLLVGKGAQVRAGQVLGQVGSSGRSSFPHLHFTLRKNGDVVDPFDPDGRITCGAPSQVTLWKDPIRFQAGAILDVGFADGVPEYDAVRAGDAAQATLPRTAPALVVFGYVMAGQAKDQMRLTIEGPKGIVIDQTEELKRTQPQLFRAVGRRLPEQGWPVGTYRGTVTLLRGGQVISSRQGSVSIR